MKLFPPVSPTPPLKNVRNRERVHEALFNAVSLAVYLIRVSEFASTCYFDVDLLLSGLGTIFIGRKCFVNTYM